MAIEDYLPNVFGNVPQGYQGLLGDAATADLQKRSNIAGLLSAGSALAQGLSSQGPRRGALQNILGALAAGYGGAGQSAQQGIQSFASAQQLQQQQRQLAGVQAMKNKYPDLADEFDTNPAGAFRIVSEREAIANKPITLGEGQSLYSPKGDLIVNNPALPKPQATLLTNQEAANFGLPYQGGEKYQKDASGKVELISGTGAKKEPNAPTSIQEYEYAKAGGYTGSYQSFLRKNQLS